MTYCTRPSIAIALSFILFFSIFILLLLQGGSKSVGYTNDTTSHLRNADTNETAGEKENSLLLWSDEFDGDELNQDYWSYDNTKSLLEQQEDITNQLIHDDDIKLNPVKDEFEFYDSHAVSVKDGILTITTEGVVNAGVPFVSGRIKTQDKVLFQYGTIEARIRIKSSCGPGVDVCVSKGNLSPSFWTRGSGSTSFGAPTMGQVDIFTAAIPHPTTRARTLQEEASGSLSMKDDGHYAVSSSSSAAASIPTQPTPNVLVENIETGDDYHSWHGNSGATWISSDPNTERLVRKSMHDDFPIENWMDQDFQIYTFDWTPTRMATYIDNELVWEMDITEGSCRDCKDFHRPHYLMLAIAVLDSPSWSLSSSSTLDLSVDYIRLLDNGFATLRFP